MCFCGHLGGNPHTKRRWWPSRSPALSVREPGWTAEMKIPLSLPPTRVMSFKRLSPCSDSSCTGLRDELILEKEDRDGRNGLHTQKKCESGQWDVCTCDLWAFWCMETHECLCCTSLKRTSWRYCWPAPGHRCPFLQRGGRRRMSGQKEGRALHPLGK